MKRKTEAKKPKKDAAKPRKGCCRRKPTVPFHDGGTLLTAEDNPEIIAGFRLMQYPSEIADRLKVSRQTLMNWISRNPELQEAQAEAEERRLDAGEKALMYLVKNKSPKAIMFQLERKGRARGYGAQSIPLTVNVPQILDDVPDDS